jgi:hypothetical protein
MITDFTFLTSRRFWALVGIAVVGILKAEAILPVEVADAIIVILGGFTVIRTIDKSSELIGA